MRRIFQVASLVLVTSFALAQGVEIDWATNSLINYPEKINGNIQVQVTVTNVNDMIYTYGMQKVASPQESKGASSVFNLTTAGAGAPHCAEAIAFEEAFKAVFEPATDGSTYKSIPLSETLRDFKIKIADSTWLALAAKGSSCVGYEADKILYDGKKALADGKHEAVFGGVSLKVGFDYKIIVTEYYSGTKTVEHTFSFSPSNDILKLSLGTLFTGIDQRTYVSPKDPANTAQNRLSVDGRGRLTPLGVALLNYQVPKLRFANDAMGVWVSSGLVLDFGASEAKASPLGFYAGASLDISRQLFLSVGAHIGQFADYPPGLGNGSIIPANFGDLNPMKRTTARLAFAITYQTKSFAKSSAKGSDDGKTPDAKAKK